MSPDKKYMLNVNNNNSDDLNLVPFNATSPSSTPIGWIPVFSFNKMNQVNSPFMLPNFSTPTQIAANNSLSSSNTSVENFPSDENIENLYSYNKSNPPTTTTTTTTNNRDDEIISSIRNLTCNLDEDTDLCRNCSDKRINKIYSKIEEKNPEIISLLVEEYRIPCPIVKTLIRKIIKMSLQYCKKAGD